MQIDQVVMETKHLQEPNKSEQHVPSRVQAAFLNRELPGSNLGSEPDYTQRWRRRFLQFLQSSDVWCHREKFNCFLPNYSPFIYHYLSYHSESCSVKHWYQHYLFKMDIHEVKIKNINP